jgi:hypothetical protein
MTAITISGTEIAKLTAMITGGGFKRANSKDAAAKRFHAVTAEKGITNMVADQILFSASFEAARIALDAAISDLDPPKAEAAPKPKAESRGPAKIKPKTEEKALGKRAQEIANAEAGILPAAPDFSANTHKPFRKKLADLVGLVAAKDLAGLKAYAINPVSSSPKALDKYRNLAVIALSNSAKAPSPISADLTKRSVEDNDLAIIEGAVEFTVARKGYETKRFGNGKDAIAAAEGAGIGAIVYAINEAGRQALFGTMTKDGFRAPKAKQATKRAA